MREATLAVSRPAVRLADVRESRLSQDEVYDAVADDRCGAVVTFVGKVRDHDHGRDVVDLDYSCHPRAAAVIQAVAASVASRFDEVVVAAVHRVGPLAVGDIAVVVAAAAPHRDEAFRAARVLIDEIKETVPIWKHQSYPEGDRDWPGSP